MTPSSLIARVAIDAVLIERRQSICKTNTLSTTRDAMATSSALKLQGSLLNKQDKSNARELWVTGQNSSRDNNYYCRSVNCRNTSMNATMKQGDPPNGKHQADWANSCPWSATMQASWSTKTQQQAAKTVQPPWHVKHAPQTTRWAQAATTTTANTILFWWDS